jgi:hypothetical protein
MRRESQAERVYEVTRASIEKQGMRRNPSSRPPSAFPAKATMRASKGVLGRQLIRRAAVCSCSPVRCPEDSIRLRSILGRGCPRDRVGYADARRPDHPRILIDCMDYIRKLIHKYNRPVGIITDVEVGVSRSATKADQRLSPAHCLFRIRGSWLVPVQRSGGQF